MASLTRDSAKQALRHAAALVLYDLAKLEAGIGPGEGLDWALLSERQQGEYLELVDRAVERTDRTRRWAMAEGGQ